MPESEYVSVSPSGSVAVNGSPNAVSVAVFSATERWPVSVPGNDGASFSLVVPVPESDHSLSPSELSARTCTSYDVFRDRSKTVVVSPLPVKPASCQSDADGSLYRTS